MKLLMHTCCAPCSVYCIDELRSEGIEPTLYWYNPNIHPVTEYIARRDTLKQYSKMIDVKAIFEDEYGLDKFCQNVSCDLANRCVNYCYRVRLEQTAKYAKENGYDAITTTLFVSIYQKHDAIKKICEEICEKYGLEFVYRDFRVGFREGQEKARELGLYMQKYCGCIYSEEDRYYNRSTKNTSDNVVSEKLKKKIFEIRKVDNKGKYLDLLLESNEDKDCVLNYLKDSEMYVLKQDDNIYSVAVILRIDEKIIELKNIVTIKDERNKGYASKLIKLISSNYKSRYDEILVGVKPNFIPFFAKQGFDYYKEINVSNDLMYYSKYIKKK